MYGVVFSILLVSSISVEAKKEKLQIIVVDGPLESLQKIGPRLYKKELLSNRFDDPKELAYDSESRRLFFMYMDDEIQNSGRAYINVLTREARKIPGIEKNKATAVDSENSNVYFGSENGLFKYDPFNNTASNIGLYNINIMKLVLRNNAMYLIDANTHMLYKVYDYFRVVRKISNAEGVFQFDVDYDRNVHFVSICGLYCLSHKQEIVKNKDLNRVYHFLVDEKRVLGIDENAMYEIHCENGTATKIADVDFIPRSIIFGDYGDIYYSINNDIYRLRPISSYRIYNIYHKTRNNTNYVN